MSASTGPNPFAKTSGLTQPLNQTKAVKQYEGNVDFEMEKQKLSFMRTQGKDLIAGDGNPYMRSKVNYSNFGDIVQKVMEKFIQSTNQPVSEFGALFMPLIKKVDKANTGSISPEEFKRIFKSEINCVFTEEEIAQITKNFNNGQGFINYNEFFYQLYST